MRCAATSSWPLKRDWTPCAYRPTSPIPSCTTPPTSSVYWCCRTFPLQWGYAHPDPPRGRASRCARRSTPSGTTRRSCSGAPTTTNHVADAPQMEHESTGRWLRRLVSKQLPTWNSSVLDRWLKRAFEQADPSRPTVAHSGVTPTCRSSPEPTATGTRLAPRRGPRARRARPHCPSHGAVRQRVRRSGGTDSSQLHRGLRAGRTSTGSRSPSTTGCRNRVFERGAAGGHPTFAAWRRRHAAVPSDLLRMQIETFRRLKYRPTGGFAFSRPHDPSPMISGRRARPRSHAEARWSTIAGPAGR